MSEHNTGKQTKNYPEYPPGLDILGKEHGHGKGEAIGLEPLPGLPENRVIIRTYGKNKKQKNPIISCGVICLRKIQGVLHVLLIRRKDSLSYVEFVRGKYKPSDPHYVRELVDGMTKSERQGILEKEFQDLWKGMWISRSYKRHRPEYDKSLHRFNAMKNHIREYIRNHPEKGWDEPEWGFPKGRPNKDESLIHCAIREFKEETGIPKEKLIIINPNEYEESYTGTNGILYKNHYIIGTCYEDNVGVNPRNHFQAKEVSGVRWVPLENAHKYVRNTYPSRLMILKNASQWFTEKYSED